MSLAASAPGLGSPTLVPPAAVLGSVPDVATMLGMLLGFEYEHRRVRRRGSR